MPDYWDIKTALITKLSADAALLSDVPNGVYWKVAPPGMTRFGIVSLVAPGHVRRFEGRSHFNYLFLVKAVVLSTVADASAKAKSAALRIDALLDPLVGPPTLAAVGLTLMAMMRDEEFDVLDETEVDDADPTMIWFHRGGYYRVMMST